MRAEGLAIIEELGYLLFLLVLLAVSIRYLEDVLQGLWRWPTQDVLLPLTRILLDFRSRLFKEDVNALIVGSSLGRAQLLLVAFDRIEDCEAGLLVEQRGALSSLPLLFGVGG